MGKIKQGILGGFSGKVGSVIGGSWKGKSYMRGIAVSTANPRTLKQRMQRTKFALAIATIRPIAAFLRIGFRQYAKGQTAFNAAMSYTFRNAITGTYPDYMIDYTKLLVSHGHLTGAYSAYADVASGRIELFWDDNSGMGNAQPNDQAMVVAINPARGESLYITDGASRSDGNVEMAISPYWTGDDVEVYLAFISEDEQNIAASVHCGTVTII